MVRTIICGSLENPDNNIIQNHIFSLEIEGHMVFDNNIIQNHILEYYKNFLDTSEDRMVSLNPDLWSDSVKLSIELKKNLDKPIDLEEVKITIFESNGTKA